MVNVQLQHFILYIHLIALAGAIIGITYADESAFSWMTGKKLLLDGPQTEQLHYFVSVSLSMLIVTGLWLFWPLHSFLLYNTYFLLKLGCVMLLVLNSIVIEYLMPIATVLPFSQVPLGRKFLFLLSGAVSFSCWVGAGVAAWLVFGWLF